MGKAHRFLLILVLFLCTNAVAQDKLTLQNAPLLNLTPNTRSWGMGQAGAAVPDPYIAFFNPGGLGVFSDDTRLTLQRNSQDWPPSYSTSSQFSNAVAVFSIALAKANPSWPRVNLSLSYLRTLYFAKYVWFYGWPERNEVFTSRTTVDAYSAAVAVGKGPTIGIGASLKSFGEVQGYDRPGGNTTISGIARDLGVFVRIPVLAPASQHPLTEKRYNVAGLEPELWMLASYAWANFGKDVRYAWDIVSRPLPRVNRFGRTVIAGIRYHDAQCLQVLLTRDDEISKTENAVDRHDGWEIGLFGVVQYRAGRYPGGGRYPDVETSGESYRLSGLWKWLDIIMGRERASAIPSYLRRWDVVFQRARTRHNPRTERKGTDLWELGVTLDISSLSGQARIH